MPSAAVREVLSLLDEAFAGIGIAESNESQALITNLMTVGEREWRALPQGATRTIESVVLHVGACKVMYDDYAFGSGTLQWGTPPVQPWEEGKAPMADALRWLRDAHQRLVDHVASLSDADLDQPRLTNWGERRATRWILAAMIGHDFYHAGEINHLRSLLGSDDRWRWQQQSGAPTTS